MTDLRAPLLLAAGDSRWRHPPVASLMTTLRPTRYADRDNSTFFEAAGDLITISYRVRRRKRLLVLPSPAQVRVEADRKSVV